MKEYKYNCDCCKKEIIGKKAYTIIIHKKSGQAKRGFCSKECRKKELNTVKSIEIKCSNCGKPFTRKEKHIKKECNFCSRSCWVSFSNRKSKKIRYCLNCGNHINGYNKFCNINCNNEYNYKKYIDDWKNGKNSGGNTDGGIISDHVRKYIFKKFDNKCAECECNKINPYSLRSILTIDHIDGDSSNHKEENLKLLCPTCHAMTKTYCALNMGNGRISRQKARIKNRNNGIKYS